MAFSACASVVDDAFGATAIHGETHLGDDVLELGGADGELVALGGDRAALREQSGMGLARREDRRLQSVDIVGSADGAFVMARTIADSGSPGSSVPAPNYKVP